jgi:hypothetical protein
VCSSDLPNVHRDRLHDLGKLVVTFSILTAYMAYSNLLPIWYENLPVETRFFIPRFSLPWRPAAVAVLAVAYLGPLVLLLTIWSKRNRWTVAAVGLAVLAAMWVERWWLVAPTFQPQPLFGLAELGPALALGGMLVLGVDILLPRLDAGQHEVRHP